MLGTFLASLTKVVIGAYPYWRYSKPSSAQRVYFANHSSHLDTMAIWSSFSTALRSVTRPVAAKDYWGKGGVRGIIARDALNVVLIERTGDRVGDPLEPLYEALEQGDSLILFPEGTRRYEAEPAAFKSGLYHLSRRYPDIEYIPVYLDNTRRSLPKGALLPLPVSCIATFGAPLKIDLEESKEDFLNRARQAVIDLSKPDTPAEAKSVDASCEFVMDGTNQQSVTHTLSVQKMPNAMEMLKEKDEQSTILLSEQRVEQQEDNK